MRHIVEIDGDGFERGLCAGKKLKESIALHLEIAGLSSQFARDNEWYVKIWKNQIDISLSAARRNIPEILDEINGWAAGSNQSVEEFLWLNFPPILSREEMQCTNVAFSKGPDGPLLGKNNDELSNLQPRPVAVRIINDSKRKIRAACISFSGIVGTLDGMNSCGLASGHSSVGSVFEQQPDATPMLLWGYKGILSCTTATQYIEHMRSRILCGKGYNVICNDSDGNASAIEAPCPKFQIRARTDNVVSCANMFQLEEFKNADLRLPHQKDEIIARIKWLNNNGSEFPHDLNGMKSILANHDNPGICKHGIDGLNTVYSYIAIPRKKMLLISDGQPCKQNYQTIHLDAQLQV